MMLQWFYGDSELEVPIRGDHKIYFGFGFSSSTPSLFLPGPQIGCKNTAFWGSRFAGLGRLFDGCLGSRQCSPWMHF